jgi:hypothetical protein
MNGGEYRCTIYVHSVFSDYNDMADNISGVDSPQFISSVGIKGEGKYNFTIATATKAGQAVKGFKGLLLFRKMSPLGNATALDCANYTVSMFSDLKWLRFKIYYMTEVFKYGSQSGVEMFE